MKLRLLVTKECNRRCAGCCNKDWDLDALPECDDFKGYSEVLITGGEPMLFPDLVEKTALEIRKQNSRCKIYVYTAYPTVRLIEMLEWKFIDGVTLTLHTQHDVPMFELFEAAFAYRGGLSLRLNVFKGVKLDWNRLDDGWTIKDDVEWIENCPLPEDEHFMRLKV